MLKGKNIYKSFDNIEVLKDINIEIERGKIVSIVGKSSKSSIQKIKYRK